MSGLIWSALGKGIADAGSAIGTTWMKSIDEDLREQRLLDREERRLKLKEDADERKEERKEQERAEMAARISKRADEMPVARAETALNRDAGKLAKSSEQAGAEGDVSLSEEQLRDLVKNDPKLRESWRKSGLIEGNIDDRIDPRLRRANDESQAARDLGAKATVIEAYDKAKKDTLSQIAQENRDEFTRQRELRADAAEERRWQEGRARAEQTNRKLDMLGEHWEKRDKAAQQTADAATTRAGRAGSSGGGSGRGTSPADKPATTADIQRQIKTAEDTLAEQLNVPKTELNSTLGAMRKKAERGDAKAQSTLEQLQPTIEELAAARKRMLDFKNDRATASSAQQAESSSTPAAPAGGAMPAPKSKADFDKLPSGTRYTAPDGTIRIKR